MLFRVIGLAVAVVLINTAIAAGVSAAEESWSNPGQYQVDEYAVNEHLSGCAKTTARVKDHGGINRGMDYQRDVCVYNAKDYSVARYVGYDNRYYWGIKLNIASSFITMQDMVPASDLYTSPSTNRLIFLDMDRMGGQSILTSVENLHLNVEAFSADEFNSPMSYIVKNSGKKHWLGYTESTGDRSFLPVLSSAYSLNSRYGLAWADYGGHVKIDFESGAAIVVTHLASIRQVSFNNPTSGAITNDGKYAFINTAPYAYDTENCGYELTEGLIAQGRSFNYRKPGCSFTEYQVPSIVGFAGYPSEYKWMGNEEGLRFAYRVFPQTTLNTSPKLVTIMLKTPGQHKLDYLALGDSYSSGEGDTGKNVNGQSYYASGTGGEHGCHLSTRSYPFLLAGLNNITPNRMKSVACSGAQVSKDYYGLNNLYFGQANQLQGKSESELSSERASALADFKPGVLKQVDFVAANKPKAITLTGGGNDVGFGKIMSYCANIVHEKKLTGTCDYAQKGTKLHGYLANAIRGQYDHIKKLIESIKATSPETTIYVVGYPSFVASKFGCINDAALNRSEVDMLNTSISYMNDVLRKAATYQGAHFIDTEGSFQGGRLCEGGAYVTSPTALMGGASLQEIFHPNALGNEKLAGAIMASGFSIAPNSNPAANNAIAEPIVPDYFSTVAKDKVEQRNLVPKTVFKKNQKIVLSIAKSLLRSSSGLTVTLFSKPTTLGTGTTDPDGSFSREITIPADISAGYHVLSVEGSDAEGNPITFYQFIEVANIGTDDIDGDGVKNAKDSCMYLDKWYDEATKKDVCKGGDAKASLTGHGNGAGLGHDIGAGKGHAKDL